jgi:hypothetical protein
MFCVDADHDRLTRSTVKCKHLNYALFPDAEAHVLDACDLKEILASVMSLPRADAAKLVAQIGDYRVRLAEKWVEWFKVCSLRGRTGSTGGPKPGTPGTAVKSNYQKIVRADTVAARKSVIAGAGLLAPRVKAIETEIEHDLLVAISRGESRTLLKGKWLAEYLKYEGNRYASKNHFKKITNSDQIHAAARSSAKFDPAWASQFRKRATALV